jgi:hypothetical protein
MRKLHGKWYTNEAWGKEMKRLKEAKAKKR